MRRNHQVFAGDALAIGRHSSRVVMKFRYVRVLEYPPTECDERLGHTGQVFPRMNPRLVGEADARASHEWNLVQVFRIEPELAGHCRVFSEVPAGMRFVAHRRMKKPIDPLEIGADIVLASNGVDLRDRRETRIPYGLRVIPTEPLDERGQTSVRDHRQMRTCVPGVGRGAPIAFEEYDALTRLGQEIRGG